MAIELNVKQEMSSKGIRDAVHVQVVAVQSEFPLYPGQPVRFVDDTYTYVVPCAFNFAHAVVNPFRERFSQDEVFLVLLFPGVSSNLLHTFTLNLPDVPPGKVVTAESDQTKVNRELRDTIFELREKLEKYEDAYGSLSRLNNGYYEDGCGPFCG